MEVLDGLGYLRWSFPPEPPEVPCLPPTARGRAALPGYCWGPHSPSVHRRHESSSPFPGTARTSPRPPSARSRRGGRRERGGPGAAGRARRCPERPWRDGVGAAAAGAAAGRVHAAPARAARSPAAPRPPRAARPHRHRHRGKQRHRRGHGAGARPLRGPRYPGDPQRPARRGRRQPHPQGDWEQRGAVHAPGPGQPALGESLRQHLPAPGAPAAPPHQQRGGERRGHHGGWLQPGLPGEPPGPFPADAAAAGAAAELRSQPGGHGGLQRPLRRPPAPREPGPAALGALPCLPGLLRQQAGQRAARPRAGHARAGHAGHLLRRAPRFRQHLPVPARSGLAEAAAAAAGLAAVPGGGRGRAGGAGLRHAAGPRAPQRPLLHGARAAGALGGGARRPPGTGAVGRQRAAAGAAGGRGGPCCWHGAGIKVAREPRGAVCVWGGGEPWGLAGPARTERAAGLGGDGE